jgi:hypothetical protein
MPRAVVLKETQTPYTLSLEADTLAQETLILEREPVIDTKRKI